MVTGPYTLHWRCLQGRLALQRPGHWRVTAYNTLLHRCTAACVDQMRPETLCVRGDAFVVPQTPRHMSLGSPTNALRLAIVEHIIAHISLPPPPLTRFRKQIIQWFRLNLNSKLCINEKSMSTFMKPCIPEPPPHRSGVWWVGA